MQHAALALLTSLVGGTTVKARDRVHVHLSLLCRVGTYMRAGELCEAILTLHIESATLCHASVRQTFYETEFYIVLSLVTVVDHRTRTCISATCCHSMVKLQDWVTDSLNFQDPKQVCIPRSYLAQYIHHDRSIDDIPPLHFQHSNLQSIWRNGTFLFAPRLNKSPRNVSKSPLSQPPTSQ